MPYKLIDFPEKIIPKGWQIEHKIKILEINGRAKALEGIKEIAKRDQNDFRKLLKTIKLQLQNKQLIIDKTKVQLDCRLKEVIEFKSKHGHARLFGFLNDEKEIIVCTNTYWKTSKNTKQQRRAFEIARKMRMAFLNQHKKGKR